MQTNRRQLLGLAGAGALGVCGFVRPAAAAHPAGAITQIARFGLDPEREAEALEAVARMCALVEAHEPGVLAYVAHREAEKPAQLVFFEVYRDAKAVEDHAGTPHMKAFGSTFGSLLLPPVQVDRLDRVAGFLR